VWGPGPTRNKSGGPRPMRPHGSAAYAYIKTINWRCFHSAGRQWQWTCLAQHESFVYQYHV